MAKNYLLVEVDVVSGTGEVAAAEVEDAAEFDLAATVDLERPCNLH